MADADVRSNFHEGELAVQRRAGVEGEAAGLARMLAPAELHGGFVRFLAGRAFAALTARDGEGRLWISPLGGAPGFIDVTSPTSVRIHATPGAGDPLRGLSAAQPVGLLAIEFAARARVRLNGELVEASADGLRIDVAQAYGNCPKYIHRRQLEAAASTSEDEPVRRGDALAADDVELIRRAGTFLIGTTHPTRGSDASHRGGAPGFVQWDGETLAWRDYPGNNLFNTFGNLAVDPAAALLFPDFATGRTLQLSGTAAVEWTGRDETDEFDTGRRVRFRPGAVVSGRLLRVCEPAR
ncbi:MAG TPA: pyridoxamine 5'-phosphate oxidase family protein [Solirubrobacteraceae bacterium]|jgi:hypothetical protein|nr:pyridoxamine 5'-phosphate oxidase family protein [Solirubrobacteraceae bacterium]